MGGNGCETPDFKILSKNPDTDYSIKKINKLTQSRLHTSASWSADTVFNLSEESQHQHFTHFVLYAKY